MELLSRLFGFDPAKHSVKTEMMAGLTTFLTMAYILAVNPTIFSALEPMGMDTSATFTATAIAAVAGTLIMALYAKKPFALAPGMGLNAFFVYTVCLSMGYSWRFALTAILIEGILFVIFTVTNIRKVIVDVIPMSLKCAISIGVGLYIALIGLENAGIVVKDPATAVTLGDITQGTPLLGCIGILITAVMVVNRIRGALLWGILATTILGIPMGITHYNGILSMPPSIENIAFQFQWSEILSWDMLVVVITFLFIDMFDTIGTIVGAATKAGEMREDGSMPGLNKAFMADALATIVGACVGTNTTTTYIESTTGIAQGGRTGLTSCTTAMCFALAMFFAPLFLSIPAAATAPVLFIVGVFMLTPIKEIKLEDFKVSIPAFVTIVMMPMSYSISDGIMLGTITHTVIGLTSREGKRPHWLLIVLSLLFAAKYVFMR